MYLIFDTETTGLPKSWNAPITNTENWPRGVFKLHGNCMMKWEMSLEHNDFLIKPEGYNIPYDAERIHGISTELAEEQGISLAEGLLFFNEVLR